MPAPFLVINSGSSTIKFAVFTFAGDPACLERGALDASRRDTAMAALFERLDQTVDTGQLAGIGHRIVHGGPSHRAPVLVTAEVVEGLESVVAFAPNHLPDAIGLIRDLWRLKPETPQVLCFDTAFHADLPDVARRLPIPRAFDERGIRRYGFHGLSYTFLTQALERIAPGAARGRVVYAHLGNGSSLAAVRGGRCIDTSMGFTPIGGVVMSTRSGNLDPGVVAHIARTERLDPDGVERVLSHESGLLGVSSRTADMRELVARESDDPDCALAVAIYCYEIRKRIGAYVAALGGIDALVFSGGIGEHSPVVRARICDGLDSMGIQVDAARNESSATVISPDGARVPVHVIATDEESVIARAGFRLLEERRAFGGV